MQASVFKTEWMWDLWDINLGQHLAPKKARFIENSSHEL